MNYFEYQITVPLNDQNLKIDANSNKMSGSDNEHFWDSGLIYLRNRMPRKVLVILPVYPSLGVLMIH